MKTNRALTADHFKPQGNALREMVLDFCPFDRSAVKQPHVSEKRGGHRRPNLNQCGQAKPLALPNSHLLANSDTAINAFTAIRRPII
jgi:hypothetical protein